MKILKKCFFFFYIHTHTHTHIYIYIYIYICKVRMCILIMCVYCLFSYFSSQNYMLNGFNLNNIALSVRHV